MRIRTTLTFENFKLTHVQGSDGVLVFRDGEWINVYRSLVAAKRYVAKLAKKEYNELSWVKTEEEA
jgi:hypothetical protein